MTDTDAARSTPRPEADAVTSTPPALLGRGQGLWTRVRTLFARTTASLRDDIEVALESEASGETADFSPSERTILQNVLQLGEKRVEDVMVPRADIEAIDIECTLGDMIARFRDAGHSRVPVYDGNIDNITGFIHVKDALRRITERVTDPEKEVPVRLVSPTLKQKLAKLEIARTVLFVPPLMPVGDLLQQMQLKRIHMAVVIDEYGGTDGLCTIEDLLEAVVGDIEDEYDEHNAPQIRKVNSNNFIASARAELSEVKDVIGDEFDPGEHAADVDTIGGLVFALAGHVPAKGETVGGIKNFEFEVLQSDTRQIGRIRIKRIKQRAPRTVKPKQAPGAVTTPAIAAAKAELAMPVVEDETAAEKLVKGKPTPPPTPVPAAPVVVEEVKPTPTAVVTDDAAIITDKSV